MLAELFIRDFAIIDRLELTFERGMTVLTGETGAGKSILLDAVKLAIGERADTSMVRHGCERAEVVARFEPSPSIRRHLADLDLADGADGELILRRVVNADGRSRAYLNGTPCPVGTLRDVGERLIEIHGQHEHYQLLEPRRQLDVIDRYGEHGAALEDAAAAYRAWRETRDALAELRRDAGLSEAERELLAFQVDELAEWADDARRYEELDAQHRRLAAAQDLTETCNDALGSLDGSLSDELARIGQRLGEAADIDPDLKEAADLAESALIHVQEASRVLSRYQRALEDTGDVEDLDRRLGRLHELSRKHRVEITEIPGVLDKLSQRLARAEDAESRERRLERQLSEAETAYRAAAGKLSERRARAATGFSKAVTALMAQLGMEGGDFDAVVAHDPDSRFAADGLDTVEFLLTTNPGQPRKPLSKIASGGELSRIGLAIKVAQSDAEERLALIFDEVDAGVGGAIAEIVGSRLRELAAGRQVFCVTHLPQVASRGHHHFRVSKSRERGTQVESLDSDARVQEIARMLGGTTITDRTRAHAQEMLEVR